MVSAVQRSEENTPLSTSAKQFDKISNISKQSKEFFPIAGTGDSQVPVTASSQTEAFNTVARMPSRYSAMFPLSAIENRCLLTSSLLPTNGALAVAVGAAADLRIGFYTFPGRD